ncbi:MAG: cyclic nucleotide-binding domain-containing protein [Candidatus Thiodiazotropha sp. (ex Lucinoma borealis)]|nr:cyclic nucleotide-binding domain-containing protein [Candidatus Thiodiazotropha sp. (ex Lucinoma borealis)]
MQQKRLIILQGMPIFGGIDEDTLSSLLSKALLIQVCKDEYFFKEDDLDNSIYILEKGRVAIFRNWQNKRYKLRELCEGDCFGEMALMDCKPRSAEVVALEDCNAIQITSGQLADIYQTNPEQFTLIYMNLGREVCRRLRDADTRLFMNDHVNA